MQKNSGVSTCLLQICAQVNTSGLKARYFYFTLEGIQGCLRPSPFKNVFRNLDFWPILKENLP